MDWFRWIRTIRHFPPKKLGYRVWLQTSKRFYTPPPCPADLTWTHLHPAIVQWLTQPIATPPLQASPLFEQQQGVILNQPFPLPQTLAELESLLASHSPLWQENYGYLEFLLPLTQPLEEPERQAAAHQCLAAQLTLWYQRPFMLRCWSTYGVARQILTLLQLLPTIDQLPEPVQQTCLTALFQNTAYLARFLEKDLGGNHLIKNLHALLAATLFFEAVPAMASWTKAWWKTLEKLLIPTFEQQVLPDGFHVECTPMYHAWVLSDLIDCLTLLKQYKPDFPAQPLQALGARMLDAYQGLCGPEQVIPLFGDSSLLQTPTFKDLETKAAPYFQVSAPLPAPPSVYALPEAGYTVFRLQESTLVIHAGEMAPKALPAHLHNDIGSFVCSVNQQPILVDAGTDDYAPSLVRDYFRSTAAHNTLWVPGLNQAECWGSFRVAEYPTVQPVQLEQEGLDAKLTVSYENHSHRYSHQRTLYSVQNRFWVVQDWVHHLHPENQPCYSLLHVHPDCSFHYENEIFTLGHALQVVPFGVQKLEWSRHMSWRDHLNLYSDSFQQACPGQLIALQPKLFDCFGWVLIPYTGEEAPVCEKRGENLKLTFADHQEYLLTWDAEGLRVAAHLPVGGVDRG